MALSRPTMTSPPTRPRWLSPAIAFVLITGLIVALGVWQPFAPGGGDSAVGAVGNAERGAGLYAESCAGCHGGAGEGGGAGPSLVRAPREADAVAQVIASGRGVMPAGIVEGQDAADVAAFVARLTGAGDDPVPAEPSEPPAPAGQLQLTGERLWGLVIELAEPAPEDWSVWLDGSAGLTPIGPILAGQTVLADPDLGRGSLIESFDTVLIGTSAQTPELRGRFSPDQITGFTRLFLGDAPPPKGQSLISEANEQVRVFSEHTRFLVAGRDEGNVANVRLHSEHLVNIAYGKPIEELDGDGTPTNPGDGVGLLGRDARPGHLPDLSELAGEGIGEQADALQAAIRASAEDARLCVTAQELSAATDCIAAIEGRGEQIDALWGEVRNSASQSAVVPLVRQ